MHFSREREQVRMKALDFAVAILELDPNVFKGARGEKRTVERRSAEEQEMAKAA